MSSSDDDIPLGAAKPRRSMNGATHMSKDTVTKSVDKAMDKQIPSTSNGVDPGISLRNGPVDEMDVDPPATNGAAKRKSRGNANAKTYKEDTSDDEPITKKRRTTNGKAAVDSDSDDAPLVSKTNGPAKNGRTPSKAAKTADSDDSDEPLKTKLKGQKVKIEKQAEKEARAIRAKDKKAIPSSAKKPTENGVAKKSQANGVAASRTPAKKVKKEESDEDVPLAKKSTKKAKAESKSNTGTPAKKGSKKAVKEEDLEEEDEEAEEEYRWWEDPTKGDGTKKWTTLEHNGVVFPPPYERLPKKVKMLYDGVPVNMSIEAEEVATFFGSMLNSTHNVENPTFQKNFFTDFTKVLKETNGATDKEGKKIAIKDFSKCDFTPIFEHFDAERAKKKALSSAEKKATKAQKDEVEAPYLYCMWDGRKQKVGNFRVEPPSLFRGRGEHPKTGMVKKRVQPEQITINIGKSAQVPRPPEGHRWKEVKHDQEGTWLAMWQENINGNYKYVMLAANSDVKGQSDHKKFEKARELKKYIDIIRKDYNRDLKAELMIDRQRATAVYLIDKFALRAGNDKSDDEADTVGCCSLKYENVTLEPPNKVTFDFLGKDSIRFLSTVEVDTQVFKNLRIFKKPPKSDGDEIFDRLTTSGLNKHLSNYMLGLTAKVFRTYNASFTMSNLLQVMKSEGTLQEKVLDYNNANREVAILCNHKRTVTAGHETQMGKLGGRLKGLKYQKWRLKQMILDVDPKQKKKLGQDFFALDDDIDQDWIKEHQSFLVEEARQKIEKKFAKDNEKRVADSQKEMKKKELDERLEAADELAAKFKQENKSRKVLAEGKSPSVEKLQDNIKKLEQRIENMALQAEDKENNKEVALGTSKINYIDPRLTVVFAKKFKVPIEKFFSKTLREKFDWAIKSAGEDWEF